MIALLAALPAEATVTLQIGTDPLPAATPGVFYNQALTVTGGTCAATGTASSTIDSGALPPGIAVATAAGVKAWSLQGVPTTGGTFQFVLHIRWTHRSNNPLFEPDCVDEGIATLTVVVQSPQPQLQVDRAQVSTTYHLAHFPPAPETVRVTAAGGAATAFTV